MEILRERGCYAFYGAFPAPRGEHGVSSKSRSKKVNQISRKVAAIRSDCKHPEGLHCVNIVKFLIKTSLLLMSGNKCVICRMITANMDPSGTYLF